MDRWTKFFKDGENLDDEQLPEFMLTKEMQQAMTTLRQFSEKDKADHLYQARINYLREQQSIQNDLERERSEKETALHEKELALQEKAVALRREQAAIQEKEAALKREQALLLEIERIKQEK